MKNRGGKILDRMIFDDLILNTSRTIVESKKFPTILVLIGFLVQIGTANINELDDNIKTLGMILTFFCFFITFILIIISLIPISIKLQEAEVEIKFENFGSEDLIDENLLAEEESNESEESNEDINNQQDRIILHDLAGAFFNARIDYSEKQKDKWGFKWRFYEMTTSLVASVSKEKLKSTEIYSDIEKLLSKLIDSASVNSSFFQIYPNFEILAYFSFETKKTKVKSPFIAKKVKSEFEWGDLTTLRSELKFRIKKFQDINEKKFIELIKKSIHDF